MNDQPETKTIQVKAKITHQLLLVRHQVDALTGEEWDVLECPQCSYMQRVQWDPWRQETLRLGEGMLTEEDAAHITELCKQGSTGRMEAQRIMARAPGHAYVRVPTEAEMRELAKAMGKESEFEAAVEQAVVDGKPLLTFGLGGATATTWPRGCGPVKGEPS